MHKQYGFTIVELMIVIVVIAILAAISLVSYSFITRDARAAAAGQEMAALSKALQMYRTKYGTLPNGSTSSIVICLSDNATACSGNYYTGTPMSNAVLAELSKVGYTKKPDLPTYGRTYSFGPGLSYSINTPVLMMNGDETFTRSFLILEGDVDCPIGKKMTDSSVYPTPSTQNATTCA